MANFLRDPLSHEIRTVPGIGPEAARLLAGDGIPTCLYFSSGT